MNTELIGKASGLIVLLSIVPYALRVYQGHIKPNPVSWSIWSLIGFVLLITYKSSGAEDNIWPTILCFTNPLLIVLISAIKYPEEIEKPDIFEWMCVFIATVAMITWYIFQDDKKMSQYALYIAIVADVMALAPTIRFVRKESHKDRPLAWMLYAVGFGLSIFSITTHTLSNYLLPVYMVIGSSTVSFFLIRYRLKKRMPLKQWF